MFILALLGEKTMFLTVKPAPQTAVSDLGFCSSSQSANVLDQGNGYIVL